MNCPKALELIKESEELHSKALVQIQQFSDTFSDMRPKNDLNIFTELRKINTEYESLKKQINENLKTIEILLQFFIRETDLHPFMLETYKVWSYRPEQLETVESVISNPDNTHIDEKIPFEEMKAINTDVNRLEANKSKAGELYLTSEKIDFETAKPFIPKIPEDIKAKGIAGVLHYIHQTYKGSHTLPDLKYYQYLAQLGGQYKKEIDPAKKESILKQIPEQLRDGNYYFFPGSVLVHKSGCWMSPSLWWGGGFDRNAFRVERDWDPNDRVVLLER